MTIEKICNLCDNREYRDFRGRELAQCTACKALERTRLLKLALDTEDILKPGAKVLHFAPERGLGRAIRKAVGDGYTCCDLRPGRYPADLNPRKFDLTRDIFDLPDDHYDLILHAHVMEHIPCDLTSVLYHLHRSLAPTGRHVFALPIHGGRYRADFAQMSEAERRAAFGHDEHFRIIGREDIALTLGMVFDLDPFDFDARAGPAMLDRLSIPMRLRSGLHGSTIFVQDKASLRLRS